QGGVPPAGRGVRLRDHGSPEGQPEDLTDSMEPGQDLLGQLDVAADPTEEQTGERGQVEPVLLRDLVELPERLAERVEVPPETVESREKEKHRRRAVRVLQLLRVGEALLRFVQSLVRVAQIKEHLTEQPMARRSKI